MALLEVKKYFHYDMRFDQLFLDTLNYYQFMANQIKIVKLRKLKP